MTRQATAKITLLLGLWIAAGSALAVAGQVKTPANLLGAKTVNAEDIFELAEKIPGLLIIDARIRMDRKQGYIEGSISLPDRETDCFSLAGVISGKHAPVLFYCNGIKCGRSVNSARVAME